LPQCCPRTRLPPNGEDRGFKRCRRERGERRGEETSVETARFSAKSTLFPAIATTRASGPLFLSSVHQVLRSLNEFCGGRGREESALISGGEKNPKETDLARNVVNQNGSNRATVIHGGESTVLLLSSSVPNLNFVEFLVNCDGLGHERGPKERRRKRKSQNRSKI